VLLDAMGTLLRLEDPVPRLTAALAEAGHPNPPEVVARALRLEIAHYRAHMLRGRDTAGLAALRRDCARVLGAALDDAPPLDALTPMLVASLRFRAYAEVPPVLAALRSAGLRAVVVSDWDCGLGGHLAALGLRRHLHAVVTSAEVGAVKPDARVFGAALTAAGVSAGEALHVGDDPVRDVEGARGVGIRALLVDRAGTGATPGAIPDLGALLPGPDGPGLSARGWRTS